MAQPCGFDRDMYQCTEIITLSPLENIHTKKVCEINNIVLSLYRPLMFVAEIKSKNFGTPHPEHVDFVFFGPIMRQIAVADQKRRFQSGKCL